jgi:periplasmic divalent cation tolerance protein
LIYFCVATAPEKDAPELARRLVEERLAACVNIIPRVRSIYRWEGEVKDDTECVLFIKTAPRTAGGFERRFRELHPYDCPELLMFAVDGGLEEYFHWVDSVTGGAPHGGGKP